MSVFVALKELELPFELAAVDLGKGAHKSSAYAKKSLTQRIPTLVHNDFALSESSAIAEYLNDTFPPKKLYPRDVLAHARARQIQAWLRSDLMPIRNERPTEVIFYGEKKKPLSTEATAAAEKIFSVVDELLIAGNDGLFGAWCIADTDLALMLNRLVLHGDYLPNRLAEYAKRHWERPSVQAWVGLLRPSL
jgi:glutathione S-transferase